MHIEHIAIWTNQLEQMREFYENYFQARAGKRYFNQTKQIASYFLNFSSSARLELMTHLIVPEADTLTGSQSRENFHIAISVGSEGAVDLLTEQIQNDGYQVVDGPRRTGDGYYECVILDPDGNRVEITV
ncbi:MAG: glyoxalase [Anaerolineales bacterium]|nr:MAG: glyoxalase [Anaerolineales bacterium]